MFLNNSDVNQQLLASKGQQGCRLKVAVHAKCMLIWITDGGLAHYC